jgi:RecJ-like exonuclease
MLQVPPLRPKNDEKLEIGTMKPAQVFKAKIGDLQYEVELPKGFMRRHGNEKPHIHHSKPHPSANDKQCDICGKMMVKHYHVCEDCWKYMKESLLLRVRELEDKVRMLEEGKIP